MKRLAVTTYEYRADIREEDLRNLTAKFAEIGTSPGVHAHYSRLDGRGGFVVQEFADDPEEDFEITLRYSPWIEFQVFPVTTIEEAFPVIQRVFG